MTPPLPFRASCALLILAGLLGLPAAAQVVAPKDANGQARMIAFAATPLDLVLDEYAQIVGRTILKAPNVPAVTVTLNSPKGQLLSPREYLLAIESVLALNNVALVPHGDKFLKVVVADVALKENMSVRVKSPDAPFPVSDDLVSQVIELKNLESAEVQPLVQELLHPFAKIQLLERNNAMLVTDTSANLQRLLDVLKYIDVPIESREEPRIYTLKFAKAADIAARITDLIADSQAELQKRAGRAPISSSGTNPIRAPTPTAAATPGAPSIIRASPPATPASPATSAATASGSDGATQGGLVQGKVKIVSDERTNILIIISRPDNFPFFDDMIEVLDRQVEPDLTVEVIRLEFSEAVDMSGILSDLTGATSGGSSRSSSSSSGASFRNRSNGTDGAANNGRNTSRTSRNNSSNNNRNESIRDFIARNTAANTGTDGNAAVPGATPRAGAAGELSGLQNLSENTRIIADERTNALLIMGRKEDIAILRQVVRQLDVMLAQVLLEALILEVNLNENISFGVDWLQRSMTAYRQTQGGPNGGLTMTEPVLSFGGGQKLGSTAVIDGAQVTRDTALNAGGLTYFGTFMDLNLDAVITMAAGDSDAKVLAAPVILTTDNTEASINVGERRPIPTTTQTATINGSLQSSVEYEDIGINLQIKPRISPNRVVVLEVNQKVDNVGGTVPINGNDIPIITTREFEALITLTNKTTLVLGGLVNEDTRVSHSKVPLLGDIPLIGNLFRSTRETDNRTELLVLLTPHVILSVEDAIHETERLHTATKLRDGDDLNGWSGNSLADVSSDGDDRTVPMRRYRNRLEQLRAEKEADRQARLKASGLQESRDSSISIPASGVPHAEEAPPTQPAKPAKPATPGEGEPQPGSGAGPVPANARVLRAEGAETVRAVPVADAP